jgi:hypothetical protein
MENIFFCTFLSHKYEVAIERKIRDWTEGCCYMWTTSKHHCTYFSRTDELHWYIFSIIYIKKRPEENCFCAFQLYPCIIKAPKIYNKNTKNSKKWIWLFSNWDGTLEEMNRPGSLVFRFRNIFLVCQQKECAQPQWSCGLLISVILHGPWGSKTSAGDAN